MRLLLLGMVAIFCSSAATPEEQALQISLDIQARHTPFGTILNPYYVSPVSSEVQTYTRCGDSAIWTGHWLASEAFRYKVTRSSESLDAAKRALRAIRLLVEVTGSNNLLARCALRTDSPFSAGPRSEEKSHGEYLGKFENTDYYWIGNTSRDQYLGVFFGLSAAYESIADPSIRETITDLATRLLDRLIAKNWAIVMPDGDISTVFWLRPDQELAIRQVGRQVNPDRFGKGYEDKRRDTGGLNIIMAFEASDENGSYFKFNLNAISWYTLIHLEEPESPKRSEYLSAYRVFRNAVVNHGNAFFNVVDRALTGPEARRDAETLDLMSQWLLRPKRDPFIDLRGKYRACGENRACDPIPVVERVSTDFLWQRSPFQLYGGGTGQIESPGIDYILPYWMGRAFELDFNLLAVSAASGRPGLAPDSIATIYGSGFTEGSQIRVTDSAGS
ncbi:MAG: hypothetical protein H7039_23795, partial [Bryobacteraceae bacterium]|nr:hypothetical protein [Bryobacteraceae bacterium]